MAFPPVSPLDFVEEDYIGFYNRAGDAPGANFWVSQLAHNTPLGIAVGFAVSSESTAIYPYLASPAVLDPGVYITEIYTNVLGRAPDAAGQAFWATELTRLNTLYTGPNNTVINLPAGTNLPNPNVDPKVVAAAQLLTEMLQSVNMQSGTADAMLMANRVTVAEDYTTRTGNANVNYSQASSKAVILATNGTPASVTTAEAVTTAFIAAGGAPTNLSLTTGVDSLTLNSPNTNVIGSFGGATGNTYTPGDSISSSVVGNTLTLADQGTNAGIGQQNPTSVPATVTGVSNLVITSGEGIKADTTTSSAGFSGLTQMTATVTGSTSNGFGTSLKAAGTTNITLNDLAQGGALDTVDGGQNIVVTSAGNSGGAIAIGSGAGSLSAAKPTGTITVTSSVAPGSSAVGMGSINTTGGTVITVTENVAGAAGAGLTNFAGSVTVNGGSATTSVTVNQTAAATAAAAVVASAATIGVNQLAAAPGVNGVAATVAAAAGKAAAAAVAGVNDAFVTITDAGYAGNAAGTIATVALNNFNGATIQDNSLATLSLTGGGTSTVTIQNNQASTPSTTLALTAGGSKSGFTLNDSSNELKTINATLTASESMFIADANLATLTVAGTGTFSLTGYTSTKLATVTVSGTAGFNDKGVLAGDAALTTGFTTTSSGVIVAALNDTTQTFAGSTGQDIITISADATKAITGGSATNNELILNNSAATFNATAGHLTNTNVTGFTILGLTGASTGTFDMSTLNPSFTSIDFDANGAAGGSTYAVIKAATGTAISIDNAGDTISVSYVDTNGAGDTTTVTLNPNGAAANSALAGGITTTSLTLQDANSVGIGTVNFVSTGNDINTGGAGAINVIQNFFDNGIVNLTVTGTAGLTINSLVESGLHQSTAITITSNETSVNGTVIGALTDGVLGNITFAGSNTTVIGALNLNNTVTNLTLSNTGTSLAVIDPSGANFTDTALTTLTLSGNVALGNNSAFASSAFTATTGFTLLGATDNAHVNITLTGAATPATDTITLGNGNDYITDGSSTGTVKVTVGTGDNFIDVHTGGNNATYSANITLGAHTDTATAYDQVNVSVTGTQAAGFSTMITGIVAGDQLVFTDAATSAANASASVQNSITAAVNLAGAVAVAFGNTVSHGALEFQFQGATYVIEQAGATNAAFAAGTDSIVQVTGVHTLSTTLNGTHVVFAS